MKTKSIIAGSAFVTILALAHTAQAGLLGGASGGFAGGLSGELGGMSRHTGFATAGELTGRGSLDTQPAARAAKTTKSAAASSAEASGGLAHSIDLNGEKNTLSGTSTGTAQAAANTAKTSTEKPAASTPAQSPARSVSADSSTDLAAQHTRDTNSAKSSGSSELSASKK